MTSLYTPSENKCMPSSNTTQVNAAIHATRSDMAFCMVSSRHVPRMFWRVSLTSPGLFRQLSLRTHSWNMPMKSPSRKTTCTKFQTSRRKKVVPGKLVVVVVVMVVVMVVAMAGCEGVGYRWATEWDRGLSLALTWC